MITGPARFPTEKNRQRLETESKRRDELIEFRKRALNAIRKKVAPEESAIQSNNPEAIQLLQKQLGDLQSRHELTKQANAIVRSHVASAERDGGAVTFKDGKTREGAIAALQSLGLSAEEANGFLTSDYMGRVGEPAYAIQNRSANMRRIQGRIEELQKLRATPAKEEQYSGGVRVSEDPDAARIRIHFPGKPDAATIAKLKSGGFRWSPSEGAWQRHLNNGGRYAVENTLRQLGHEKQAASTVAPSSDSASDVPDLLPTQSEQPEATGTAAAKPEPTPGGAPAAVPPEHRQYVERMDRAEKQAEEEIASVAWNTAQANKAPHSRNNPEKVSDESKRVTRVTALLPHWKHAVQNGRAEVAAEAARRMRAHGAAELHAVGETVPFDGRTMEAQVGVNEGDPVRVTRHGWHVPGRPGEPIGRAQVEPVSGSGAATGVDTGGAGGDTTPTQGGSAMNVNAGGGDPPKVPPVASGAGDGGMSRREAAAHIGNLLSDYDSDLSYNVFGRKDGRVGVAVTETRKKGKKQVSEEIGIIHINPDGSVEVPPEIKHYLRYGGGPKVHDAISSVRARAEAVEPQQPRTKPEYVDEDIADYDESMRRLNKREQD